VYGTRTERVEVKATRTGHVIRRHVALGSQGDWGDALMDIEEEPGLWYEVTAPVAGRITLLVREDVGQVKQGETVAIIQCEVSRVAELSLALGDDVVGRQVETVARPAYPIGLEEALGTPSIGGSAIGVPPLPWNPVEYHVSVPLLVPARNTSVARQEAPQSPQAQSGVVVASPPLALMTAQDTAPSREDLGPLVTKRQTFHIAVDQDQALDDLVKELAGHKVFRNQLGREGFKPISKSELVRAAVEQLLVTNRYQVRTMLMANKRRERARGYGKNLRGRPVH
jgi:hypothetical protein